MLGLSRVLRAESSRGRRLCSSRVSAAGWGRYRCRSSSRLRTSSESSTPNERREYFSENLTISMITPANPYEASVVKRADECTTGAGWPSAEHLVKRLCQAIGADLISVAGHSA